MKKIIALVAALTAAPAFATAVCTGATSAASVSVAAGAGGGAFIVNAFDMKCSSNVVLDFETTDVIVAVGSASIKGKNVFAGSSAGGAVAPTGTTCPTTGCSATESAAAATAAMDAAGSAGSANPT